MNVNQTVKSGQGMLKNSYPKKGPISQMNENLPMISALRAKVNALKTG